ncbi:MAG: hypothetical protein DCC55_12060 [Chloroflexi bacterium]|nr:MAG: hypothetical protein DCC55_12060 [Chloroflexota bacterium]
MKGTNLMYVQSILEAPCLDLGLKEKALALLVVISLLLQPIITMLPPQSLPAPNETVAVANATADVATPTAPPPATARPIYPLPAELVGKPEVAALRTAHSATFAVGDNEYAVLQELQPIHYQDATGAWRHIDPAFVRTPTGWQNTANTVHTALAQRTSLARISGDGVGVEWRPVALEVVQANGGKETVAQPHLGESAAPGVQQADGNTVRYPASWSLEGLQDQWQSGRGQVEYAMRLPNLPLSKLERGEGGEVEHLDLRVLLRLTPGTTIEIDGEPVTLTPHSSLLTRHALTFVTGNGAAMLLQPPITYEQEDPENAAAGSYVLSATADPNVVELRVRTPWDWLAAPERRFPVIIDPVFQMRSGTFSLTPVYKDFFETFVDYSSKPGFGQFKQGVKRYLVKFDIPKQPPGTTVTKAHFVVTPTGQNAGSFGAFPVAWLGTMFGNVQMLNVRGFALDNDNWQMSSNKQHILNAAPLAPAERLVFYTNGNPKQPLSAVWDVTDLASQWLTPGQNHGLMVATQREFCYQDLNFVEAYIWPCGGFDLDNTRAWRDEELAEIEANSTPDENHHVVSESGGVRLIAYYTGPTLNKDQVITTDNLFLNNFGLPSSEPAYYHTDQEYRLAALPMNNWYAVATRGFGDPFGPNPPTLDEPSGRNLRGSVDFEIYVNNGKPTRQPGKTGNVNHYVIDGRNVNTDGFRALVKPQTGENLPSGYDIRLIGERESLAVPLGGSVERNVWFSSLEPLHLYNVALPPGSNSRVDVRIVATNAEDTTQNFTLYQNADDFFAELTGANTQVAVQTIANRGLVGIPVGGVQLTSGIVSVPGGNYALALGYTGPEVLFDKIEIPSLQAASAGGEPLVVQYHYNLRITACGPGEYPTSTGGCQRVECPTSAFAAANRRDNLAGLQVWSAAGWSAAGNPATTNLANIAPLIGGAGNISPHVAVIEGTVSINGNDIRVDRPDPNNLVAPTVILVDCGQFNNPPATPADSFTAYTGPMRREFAGQPPVAMAALIPGGVGARGLNPWYSDDLNAGDVSQHEYRVLPAAGSIEGKAQLRRLVPADLRFDVTYSGNIGGYSSLNGEIVAAGNLATLDIASLALALGNDFSLDWRTYPVLEDKYSARYFGAVRAAKATVTQHASLGGASKPVQALLLPRGVKLPSEPQKSCAGSCVDVRAPSDTPTAPNRKWAMPDVHTDVQAGMMAMNAAGSTIVYSTDHPQVNATGMNAPNISQSFSFDAFNATVSVEEDYCATDANGNPSGPKVLVIRGETRLALPNIGSAGDPNAGISAKFKLCQTSLRSVHLSFQSPVGVPIGSSGLFLTGLSGSVDIFPEHTTIRIGLDFQAAPGGNGGIFKAHGEVVIDTRGLFAFQGDAKILGVVNADGKLWVAWNPMDIGFEVNVRLGSWLKGFARAHMWQGRGFNNYTWLPDNDEMHFTAALGATITIEEDAIFWGVPWDDISFGVELAFGEFCTNSSCTRYEFGVKGKFEIAGFDVGLYYGFDEGLDFILGNDNHVLIDQHNGAKSSPVFAAGEMADLSDPVTVQGAPATINGVATITFTVSTQAEEILVGIGWQAGTPSLSLVRPDGVEITTANANQHGAQTEVHSQTMIFGVEGPMAGVWQARISNLSDEGIEHYRFFHFASKGAPGTPGNRGAFVNPLGQNEPGTNSYTINWQAPPDTPATATVSLYYARTDVITGNLQIGMPIVKNLPFVTGSYEWNTSKLLNGSYRVTAVVDDGINELPTGKVSVPDDACLPMEYGVPRLRAFDPNRFPGTEVFTATGTIQINDVLPPATPTGLTVVPGDGALLAKWNPSPEPDVNAYLIRWGQLRPDVPVGFLVQNQALVAASELPQYRIGALKTGLGYGVDIAALDINGNASPFSEAVKAVNDSTASVIPLAPENFALAGRTSDSASFSWMPAAGPSAASFRLTYVKLGAGHEVGVFDVTGTAATIPNLETGAVYQVMANAANADGWRSANSDPIRVLVTNGVDANGDGMADDWAAAHDVTNANADDDNDGLTNGQEYAQGSNPRRQDSDGDGLSDFEEQAAGTDPANALEYGGEVLQPRLLLEHDRLTFKPKLQPGGEAPAQSIKWLNAGGGTLNLQASTDAPWITASVVSDTVQVALSQGNLTPGFQSGIVRLAAAEGSGPIIGGAACIRVNAWVAQADNDTTPLFDRHMFLPLVSNE